MTRVSPAVPMRRARASRKAGRGGTVLGIFIGLVLGLGLAAVVAYYLSSANSPFLTSGAAKDTRDPARDPGKGVRSERSDVTEKPRFDFYKILPSGEEPKQADRRTADRTDRAIVEQARDRSPDKTTAKAADRPLEKAAPDRPPDKLASVEREAKAPKPGERFWLQAGSFANESDADNLKARLALAGWQANVQTGVLPDKAVRFRVRLGPYDNTDELTRIKADLAKNGFDAAVIKF
ncbi:MAG: SPOR domain-containing protein [Casimicrobiaceae bacterium]